MPDALEYLNVRKRFGKVRALNGFTLRIPGDGVFGLIGPNGAGKTTAIKLGIGLLRPDEGEVKLFGEDPYGNPNVRFEVGVIHERAAFPKHVRAGEFLKHVARMYGEGEEEVREVMKLLGISEVADRKIGGLSAGTLRKLSIAQAIIHRPRLVIADEPTANLDPLARAELLETISVLHKDEGMGFLVSSHVLSELERVCDRLAFVYAGKVRLVGDLSMLIESFKGLFKVSCERAGELAKALRGLPYVREVRVAGGDLVVRVDEGFEDDFYRDVSSLAKEVGVKLYYVGAKGIRLEELFRSLTSGEGGIEGN